MTYRQSASMKTGTGSLIFVNHIISIYTDVNEGVHGFHGRLIAKTTDGEKHVVYATRNHKSDESARAALSEALDGIAFSCGQLVLDYERDKHYYQPPVAPPEPIGKSWS